MSSKNRQKSRQVERCFDVLDRQAAGPARESVLNLISLDELGWILNLALKVRVSRNHSYLVRKP
jgi:hypothetical protein